MSKILYFRLGIFIIIDGLPIIAFQWSTLVLPELLQKSFSITDKTLVSYYASLFYVSYFCGLFLSCFIWPFVVRKMSKRKCVLFSTFMYGIMTMLSGWGSDISFMLIFRFITGMFLNVNSIGKDLLFEFAKGNVRQLGLSLDSAIDVTMNLAGPLLGLLIYHATDCDVQMTLIYIGSLFIIFGLIFFVSFFVIAYHEETHKPINSKDEEQIKMIETQNGREEDFQPMVYKNGKSKIKTRSTKKVIYWCLHHKALRNPILIYAISIAVTNCDLLLTVVFLETSWKDKGMGISEGRLSFVFALSVIPACIILLISPKYCPSKIGYLTFMRFFIATFGIGVFFTPFLRDLIDLIPAENPEIFRYLVYLLVLVKNCSNGRLYAPFIHFHLNNKSNKYIRTLINTISFMAATLFIIILVHSVVPLLSILLFDPKFTQYAPYNKYPLFLILVGLQVLCSWLVEDSQVGETLQLNTEILNSPTF